MIKTCPICKKEFETDNPKRKYCNFDCYKKSKKNKNIEKTCPVCNKNFKTTHKEQIYCSYKCAGKVREVEKLKLTCPVCKKVFYKKQCDIKNVKGEPCCSSECNRISKQKYQQLGISCSTDRIHHIWLAMYYRCYNENNHAYKNYGARGITVCDEWQSFENFYNWAKSNGYQDNLTIERIDVNGNYEPSNCTWISMEEQAKNKQNTLKVQYKNKETRLKDVAKKENIDYKELWSAYRRNNNDLDKAIEICNLHKNNLIATNKSGHRGVYFYKGKWTAYFRPKYLGRYNTFEEAVNARIQEEENRKKAGK